MEQRKINVKRTHPNFFWLMAAIAIAVKIPFGLSLVTDQSAYAAAAFTYTFIIVPPQVYGSLFLLSALLGLIGSFTKSFVFRMGAAIGLFCFSGWGLSYFFAYSEGLLGFYPAIGVYVFLAGVEFLALREPFTNPLTKGLE